MTSWLRRSLQALAILAGAIGLIALGAVGYIVAVWDRPVTRAVREVHAPRDPRAVARGAYLYTQSMLCWTCHGANGGRDRNEPQAGGKKFDLRDIGPGFGIVWASNLTSDPDTGVGAVTDGELVRAIREGVDHRGRVIFPVMAYQFYHGLSDEDALAVVAYVRTLAPVRHQVPPRALSFSAKALIAFGLLAPEAPILAPVVAPSVDNTIEYGRYLAWHASGCAECHTPRFAGNGQLDRARLMGGGLFAIPEAGFMTTGPNLTRDEATGLGRWTEAQFMTAVRTGTRPDGTVMLPFMPWPTYASWSDEDVRAVWLYLRAEPPVSHAVPKSTLTGGAVGPPGADRGAALFDVYCVACHGDGGRGASLTSIALAEFARGAKDDDLLPFIVNGGPPGVAMPAFGRTLSTDQIKDIIAYLKSR